MNRKLNCLSYWFPRIKDIVPVPKTTIIRTGVDLIPLLDGKPVEGFEGLVEEVSSACDEVGYPAFLRTGQTSGKHDWLDTCLIKDRSVVGQHMLNLVEYSEMCSLIGLPYDVWVVREMLPTKPIGVAFMGMPVCREFRVFVSDAEVICTHPYWPKEAFKKGVPERYNELCQFKSMDEEQFVRMFASMAGKAVGGSWSVDLLDTERGWFVTDMAVASDSWHWPECPREGFGSA